MDYLGKEEMLTNRDVNTFVGSVISALETWNQHFTFCVYIFVQVILATMALPP